MASITESLGKSIAHVGDLKRTPNGDLGTIEGLANLKNALFHRLMTQPGSLVHRPTYGVGILAYQNAPNSFTIQRKLAALIQEQFLQDPRVKEVTSVRITSEDNTPQRTVIAVSVKPVGYEELEMLFRPFYSRST